MKKVISLAVIILTSPFVFVFIFSNLLQTKANGVVYNFFNTAHADVPSSGGGGGGGGGGSEAAVEGTGADAGGNAAAQGNDSSAGVGDD